MLVLRIQSEIIKKIAHLLLLYILYSTGKYYSDLIDETALFSLCDVDDTFAAVSWTCGGEYNWKKEAQRPTHSRLSDGYYDAMILRKSVEKHELNQNNGKNIL